MVKDVIIFEAVKKEKEKKEVVSSDPPKTSSDMPSQTDTGILSKEAFELINLYEQETRKIEERENKSSIKVGEVLGSVAFAYERVRNALDYKGEHLLRRNAIERILRRQIWERLGRDVDNIAGALIKELIWARYLRNEFISKTKVKEVSKVIEKHFRVLALITDRGEARGTREWFLSTASCEIEEILDPTLFSIYALNNAMFSWFKKAFDWEDNLSEKEKNIQLFIAVHKSLSKSDDARVRYHFLKIYYPEWEKASVETIDKDFDRIVKISREIDSCISSPIQPRIYRFVQKHAAAFYILKDVIEDDVSEAREMFEDEELLEDKVREACDDRYEEIRRRVNTGIIRSIIYIFTSKVLLALLIEIPFELIFLGGLNYLTIGINTTVPPALMFLVGLSIKKPGETNTERIIEKIKGFMYKKNKDEKTRFSLVSFDRHRLLYRIFFALHGLFFLITFVGISYFLIRLNFNIISGMIFFVFLSLVLLFGYRVRFMASELNVTGEKEGFLSSIVTNFTLPLLNLGVWLSQGLAKLSFLMVIMDFLIEAPLKTIIGVIEEWTSFVRERREEVVSVPM
jgi:hypothetical protein